MPRRTRLRCSPALLSLILVAGLLPASASAQSEPPAHRILRSLGDDALRSVAARVLDENPRVLAARARVDALAERPEQARALPDPMARATAFALPPETRVGPQRLSLGVEQRLPWSGTLELRGRAAELSAEAAEAELEALRLRLLTQTRTLWHELAFVRVRREVLREERRHLERHEDAARARYAAGTGLAQGPVKIQAELSRIDAEILAAEAREEGLRARLDALRDRFDLPLPGQLELPAADRLEAKVKRLRWLLGIGVNGTGDADDDERRAGGALRAIAFANRPELAAAGTERRRAAVGVEQAELAKKPEFTFGLAWTLVDERSDPASRANPPPDDGEDILALSAGLRIPLWRDALDAGVAEAAAMERVAGAEELRVASEIRSRLADLASRLPLEHRQWVLLRDVLDRQAEEAVSSATAAYSTGRANALDLLDAEHRLFEVRLATARANADVAIALAELEGALAAPLDPVEGKSHD